MYRLIVLDLPTRLLDDTAVDVICRIGALFGTAPIVPDFKLNNIQRTLMNWLNEAANSTATELIPSGIANNVFWHTTLWATEQNYANLL